MNAVDSVVVYAVERGEGREVKEAFASDGEPTAADTDEVGGSGRVDRMYHCCR